MVVMMIFNAEVNLVDDWRLMWQIVWRVMDRVNIDG